MSKASITCVVAGAFVGVTLALMQAAPVMAQPPGRGPGGLDGRGRGGPPNVTEMFSRMDRNEDGKLTEDEVNRLRELIDREYRVEGELKKEVDLNLKRLVDIGSYRGIRHRIGLPLRGQSTKNNARTRKGRRKTIANKKKATK